MQQTSRRRGTRPRARSLALAGIAMAVSSPLVSCGSDEDSGSSGDLDQVTVQLQLAENGTFSPFWYGVEEGIYADHGIDLTIEPGISSQAATDAVVRGDADFSSSSFPSVVLNQATGNPIVGIAEFVRGGNQGLLVGADSGISSWSDLSGKSVIVTTGSSQKPLYDAALEAASVDPGSVEVVNVNQSVINQTFASGEADAVLTLFPFSEPQVSKSREIEALAFEEAGLEMPGFFLISNEDFVAENPDLTQRFVDATLQSWAAAYENRGDAVAAMLEENPALNQDDASATFAAFADYGCGVNDNGSWFGDFTSSELEEGFSTLVATGLVEDGAVDLDKAFPRSAVDAVPAGDRIECSSLEARS